MVVSLRRGAGTKKAGPAKIRARRRSNLSGRKLAENFPRGVRLPPDCVAKLENTGLNKILANVSSSPVLVRDSVLKRIGGPLNESVSIDVVPRVRKQRTLQ